LTKVTENSSSLNHLKILSQFELNFPSELYLLMKEGSNTNLSCIPKK